MPTWAVGRVAAIASNVELAVRRVRSELERLRRDGAAVPSKLTIEVKVLDSGEYLAKAAGPWVEPDRPSRRQRSVSVEQLKATASDDEQGDRLEHQDDGKGGAAA